MNDTVPMALLSETDILIRAARLVDRDEITLAVKLLEQAHSEKPRSERLLSILSNLHHKLGNYAKAKEFTEAAFYDLSPSAMHSEMELPNESDVSFLADKSSELVDVEYNFESSGTQPIKSPRKTLSLNRKVNNSSDESEVKIYHRSKKKNVLLKPLNLADEADLPVNSSSSIKQVGIDIPKPCTKSLELQSGKSLSPAEDLDDYVVEELDGFFEQLNEEDTNDDIASDIYSYAEEVIPEDELFVTDNNELELYDLWVDDEQVNDDNAGNSALENSLTFEERARFVAVDCIIEFGWHARELPFLVDVFSGSGWHNTKVALSREVQSGATVEELELAFEVKTFWKDSSRYWITFSKAWVSGESAGSTYKHCSWKQALRLVRLFNGVPTFEEIYDFLETEFEYWYAHTILRRCFPAFNHYLFSYRLHSRNIDSMFGGFAVPEFFDGLNTISSHLPHSDEMLSLKDMGIDLANKFVSKNSFVSDDYTDDYLLELWNQKA
ncbi:tetratricopeptide repeat protein [Vibrio splendidus]|nr:tetratricopeptide repeat protein [Vibrio splendidus]